MAENQLMSCVVTGWQEFGKFHVFVMKNTEHKLVGGGVILWIVYIKAAFTAPIAVHMTMQKCTQVNMFCRICFT